MIVSVPRQLFPKMMIKGLIFQEAASGAAVMILLSVEATLIYSTPPPLGLQESFRGKCKAGCFVLKFSACALEHVSLPSC